MLFNGASDQRTFRLEFLVAEQY